MLHRHSGSASPVPDPSSIHLRAHVCVASGYPAWDIAADARRTVGNRRNSSLDPAARVGHILHISLNACVSHSSLLLQGKILHRPPEPFLLHSGMALMRRLLRLPDSTACSGHNLHFFAFTITRCLIHETWEELLPAFLHLRSRQRNFPRGPCHPLLLLRGCSAAIACLQHGGVFVVIGHLFVLPKVVHK